MLLEDHHGRLAIRSGDALVGIDAPLGEREARHHVGDPHHAGTEEGAADRLAVGLVAEREDGIGVRVIDEARRQERVQERLDARVRGRGVEEARAKLIDHDLVRHRGERAKLAERLEAHRGVPCGLDGAEVPARSLDVNDLDRLAQQRTRRGLDRGVAAAMEHQRRLATDEARSVRAERQGLGGVAL